MSKNNKAPMIKLAGLWKEEGKDNVDSYSGKLGYGTRFLLFRNQSKRDETDPDFVLYLAKSEEGKPMGDGFLRPPGGPDPDIPSATNEILNLYKAKMQERGTKPDLLIWQVFIIENFLKHFLRENSYSFFVYKKPELESGPSSNQGEPL